jgi:hypothetical protein
LGATLSSPTDQDIFTFALWVKRSALGSTQQLFGVSTNHSFGFTSGDALNLTFGGSSALTTTALFRDPSAWYHIMWVQNGTSHTLYVNGTSVGTATATSDTFNTAVAHQIGAGNTTNFFNGYLAYVHFIDGQAKSPSAFGADDDNGIWQPLVYTGGYGANGFELKMDDNASTTTIGYDAAGSNDWTANNLSVTAGAGNDSLVDVPTNGAETDTGVGGEVRGNYCTLNPLALTAHTLANGNLDASSSAVGIAIGTIAMSTGKWYWEITLNTVSANVSPAFGYVNQAFNIATAGTTYLGSGANDGAVRRDNGAAFQNNTSTSYTGAAGFSAADVAMVAFDADAKKMWVGKNGTWYNTGDPSAGTGQIPLTITGTAFFPAFNTYGDSWSINFGQRAFAYNVSRSGFKALNTANLPAPLVTKPSDLFDVKLYTGNGSTQTISGLGFSPDLVWIKNRAAADNHKLTDIVRGATEELESNTDDAEATNADGLTQFNADGFDLGDDDEYNTSSEAYVAWAWDAGTSTVTNTDGSISSQVRANASAGFSVVTYTGTNVAATIGHGLGVAPELIICKSRSGSTGWLVYHKSLGNTNYLILNATDASAAAAGAWNNTTPTSTVFTIGTGSFVNTNGATQVSYCFAPVAGYSSFGSYTSNNSSDGPFVYTGFRPRYVLIKNTTTSSTNWRVMDSARDDYNDGAGAKWLKANTSDAEVDERPIDFLSNGFKFRVADAGDINHSTNVMIYAAFAEHPFQYARAR